MIEPKYDDDFFSREIRSLPTRQNYRMSATGIASTALYCAGWPKTARALIDAWLIDQAAWESQMIEHEEATP